MKGKVYRRNINPSIHQPRAAAKDLISSGASKHGVLGDKLYRGIERGKGGEEGVQGAPGKNSHSSRVTPRPHVGDLISDVSSDLSEHQERALSRGHVASIVACLRENRINTSINGAPYGANIFAGATARRRRCFITELCAIF